MRHHIDKTIRQITADKKKLGIMICTLAIGLLLWGRLLLQGVPQTATAGDETTKTAQSSPKDDNNPAASKRPRPVVRVDLPAEPGRDLFGLDPSRYKRTFHGSENHDDAKSTQITPDVDPRVAAVYQEATELKLESVVTGNQPRAYINGLLLQPGDEVEGFTLVKVTDRNVILTKYGLFIKLRM